MEVEVNGDTLNLEEGEILVSKRGVKYRVAHLGKHGLTLAYELGNITPITYDYPLFKRLSIELQLRREYTQGKLF